MLEIILTVLFLIIFQLFPLSTNLQILLLVIYIILITPSLLTYIKGPPFVPSNSSTIKNALKLADLKNTDIVYDLGCGDGRFLIEASSFCKLAIGYETSLLTYFLAKFRTRNYSNIQIQFSNFWKADLSQANVIFCFLLKPLMTDVETTIWPQLNSGSKLISNTFKLPNTPPTQNINSTYLYQK